MNQTHLKLLKSAATAAVLLATQIVTAEPAGQASAIGPAISAAGVLSAGTLEQEQRADRNEREFSPAQRQRARHRELKQQALEIGTPLINVYP